MSLALVETKTDLSSIDLDEIARLIEQGHSLVLTSLSSSIHHAIRTGELLLEARSRVPFGEWEDWFAHNTPDVTIEHARTYMRVARHRDLILREAPPSLKAATKLLRRTTVSDVRFDKALRVECRRLKNTGLLNREIALEMGVSKATISRWLDPVAEQRYRAARRGSSRAGRLALKAEQRKAAAKAIGGNVAEGYALIRRALDVLERAASETSGDPRSAIRSAMNSLYNAEDQVARAVRLQTEAQEKKP